MDDLELSEPLLAVSNSSLPTKLTFWVPADDDAVSLQSHRWSCVAMRRVPWPHIKGTYWAALWIVPYCDEYGRARSPPC